MSRQDLSESNKSTNGRTFYWYLVPLRAIFRVLSAVAPKLAGRIGLDLFRTPRRHRRPRREIAWLEASEPILFLCGGEKLAAWSWGSGPTVLLVHGWEGRGSQMAFFVEPLVDAGYRVVALDAPGHGDSGGKRSSLPQFAAAIRDVANRVGPVHAVVAHSFGAAGTAWAVRQGLHVNQLVFVAPPGDLQAYILFFADLLALSTRSQQEMVRRLERRFDVRWSEVRRATLTPIEGSKLLVISDAGDTEAPLGEARRVAQAWPGAEIAVTSGLGHRRILRDPNVAKRVVAFLSTAGDRHIESAA